MSNHSILTHAAIEALPDADRAVWGEHAQALIDEYCFWPDWWFDPEKFAQINPFQLCIDGLQFHYPPISHVHEQYLYWRTSGRQLTAVDSGPNANWRFMRQGITHYIQAVSEDVAAQRTGDAAKRLGILLHVFQDTHMLHALEGPLGTDCFVLDRLLPPAQTEHGAYRTPTSYFVHAYPTRADIAGHAPRLQGATAPEATLRLYARYVDSALANRQLHLPFVQARMAGDEDEAQRLFAITNDTLAKLTADVIHTVTAIATQSFEDAALAQLDEVYLDQLHPVYRPWLSSASMYQFMAMTPGACLDGEFRKHPLRVRVGDAVHETPHGWGGGGHAHGAVTRYELPPGVYAALTGMIGLHQPLGRGGCVNLTVRLDDEQLLATQLSDTQPTAVLDLPIAAGGTLEFHVLDGDGDPNRNNLAWCDLKLVK